MNESISNLDELILSKPDLDELIEFMMSKLNSSRKFFLRHEICKETHK